MGNYSLAAKFASETIGTALAIAFGLGIVANELLPKSKGNGFGKAEGRKDGGEEMRMPKKKKLNARNSPT